jgi:hypothetical protein
MTLVSEDFNEGRMQQLTGRFKSDLETSQMATYSIVDGIATIFTLSPVFTTVVNIPLPFSFPVNDLGSNTLKRLTFNIDSMSVTDASCPTQAWIDKQSRYATPTISQVLYADYVGLL